MMFDKYLEKANELLAKDNISKKDFKLAVQCLKESSKLGNFDSLTKLGELSYLGNFISKQHKNI